MTGPDGAGERFSSVTGAAGRDSVTEVRTRRGLDCSSPRSCAVLSSTRFVKLTAHIVG
jgi:hypothetical protein